MLASRAATWRSLAWLAFEGALLLRGFAFVGATALGVGFAGSGGSAVELGPQVFDFGLGTALGAVQAFGHVADAAQLFAQGFGFAGGFASNGYGEHSPQQYGLAAALVAEVVLTAVFLVVILGATDPRAPAGFAPVAIGLCLTLIHLISIPVTNTSVNPARSTGVAVITGGWALGQLWLFWVAPLLGGVIGALVYRGIAGGQGVNAKP